MQKHLYTFFYLVTSLLILSSCDPCKNLDCLSSNYYGQFRIVSKVDGKDLIFGPTAIYDKTKIKFYSLNGADTVHYKFETIKFPGSGYDSILFVNFFPQTNNLIFMKLNNMDTDTLSLSFNTFKTKCCGNITEIVNFRYNNQTDLPGNKGTHEIKK
jgi:hypothetical protein